MRRLRTAPWPAYAAIAVILAGGLAVRAHNLAHGLTFVFHADEAIHFTPLAVDLLREGSLAPGYFHNPPAYTYLV